MSNQTAEVDTERELSSQQLRFQRLKVYRSKVSHSSVFPCINGRMLAPAPESKRKSNFLKFVELYFSKIVDKAVPDPEFGDFPGPTKLTKYSTGYKAFSLFSETDYGSSVVKEMITNPKQYIGFIIQQGVGNSAAAAYGGITIPKIFPNQTRFTTGGQKIDEIAVLYHEFSHTRVFQPASSQGKAITIRDERLAVMMFENPVRIRKGFEPRYSYTMRDGSYTINIITGEKIVGKYGVSKYDPCKLVKPGEKDAL